MMMGTPRSGILTLGGPDPAHKIMTCVCVLCVCVCVCVCMCCVCVCMSVCVRGEKSLCIC